MFRLFIWAAYIAAIIGVVANWQVILGLPALLWAMGVGLQVKLDAPHGPVTNFDCVLLVGFLYWIAAKLTQIARQLQSR